jgi:peptidoglycan/LPS O-acetylase OafA/YrhL
LRFARNRSTVFDSLDRNAYGMYLIHYPIASLFMFALLGFALPALGKAALAVLATVVVSWVATSLLRRIGAVAKVIG